MPSIVIDILAVIGGITVVSTVAAGIVVFLMIRADEREHLPEISELPEAPELNVRGATVVPFRSREGIRPQGFRGQRR